MDIDGEVAECLTRFTSLVPSAFHKSTVRTQNEMSRSLRGLAGGKTTVARGDVLYRHFFLGLLISHDEANARRRCDGPAVLITKD